MPTQALDGITSYEHKTKKMPDLGGIKDFGATVYIKDMWPGKLDVCTWVGCFVRYNSESKGYCIHWLDKKSVTVKCNIVFNKNNTTSEDVSINILD